MSQYRKVPVVIEAFRIPYDTDDAIPFLDWAASVGLQDFEFVDEGILIKTLEGDMLGMPGSFVIQGVQGEFYPCQEDIFYATYEELDIE